MATSPPPYFLQSRLLNSKRYFSLHLLSPTHTHPRFSKFSRTLTFQPQGFAKLNVKCFLFTEKKRGHLTSSNLRPNHLSRRRSDDKNPFQITAETILKALNALKMPAIAAVLLGLLLMCHPNNPAALAASGGRMGGSCFSSDSSNSSSSWNGGSIFSSYSVPYYASIAPPGEIDDDDVSGFVLVFLALLPSCFFAFFMALSPFVPNGKTSVLKLQVGLLGTAQSLQRDLNRIAKVADTSTQKGLSSVLIESTLALLRHRDYCISCYSSAKVKCSIYEGNTCFNKLSIEERGKFDEETLVNVNNAKRQSTGSQKASGISNEYIVITILVAVKGVEKLPQINGSGDLKKALQKLSYTPTSKLQAVEVLWTPQNESDTLSEQQLLQDYPLLRPLLI